MMSLGVDDRSPSSAEASEMMEEWREWHGLTRTAATRRDERENTEHLFSFGRVWAPTAVNRKHLILLNNTLE